MLRNLVQLSLRQRYVVMLGAVIFMVVGIATASRAPLDVFPEFAPPLVEIQTEAPGFSSDDVERLVTIPLESVLQGIPRTTALRSRSVQGLSSVTLWFQPGTDIFTARQMVTERLANADLAKSVKTPRLLPPLSSTSRVLHIGLTPKKPEELPEGVKPLTQTDISVLMEWEIQRQLLSVPGVANVSTYGLHDKEYQVLVKPAKLRDYQITLDEVKQAVGKSVIFGSAGFHDTPNQRLPITYATKVTRPEDLADIVVAHRKGTAIRLEDVAELTTGNAPFIGEGVVNDEPGLFVVVEKFPWGNTLQVTNAVEEKIKSLKKSLPAVEFTTNIFRPATFIEQALGNLRQAMIWGSIFVAIILIGFLFEWRTALISLVAIPLSIISALVLLSYCGVTINTMVLAGLAIAIGEVVDDAIIDVENVVRRLQQNSLLPQPRPAFNVVLDASLEVRSAVVYASFIVVLVCLPIFFMQGVAGAFFRPLALSYILAVMASLVVALIVTPAMCLILLPRAFAHREAAPLIRAVRWAYSHLLAGALRLKWAMAVVLLGLLVGAGMLFTTLKEEYLPQFQEYDFVMHWVAKPGTGLEVMTRDICQIGHEMQSEKAVEGFGSHIARAEVGEEVVGSNFAELWVSLGDFHGDFKAACSKIDAIMDRHPGFQHDRGTYLQERMKEVLSGAGATVVMRIYGPELQGLRDRADQVMKAVEGSKQGQGLVPGVINLKMESQVLVPQIRLDPRLYETGYGLYPKDIADAVSTLVNGTVVAEVHQDQKKFDIVVRGHPSIKHTIKDLDKLLLPLPGGNAVPLDAVATLSLVNAPNTIRHDKASRCIDVTCNIKDRDLGSVVRDLKQRVDELDQRQPMPGYRVEFLGEYQARTENQRQLVQIGLLALLGIAILLYIDFQSLRLTLLVLMALPFALIGGVVACVLAGDKLFLGSLVGFITVFGIAARNSIMLISHYRHLQREEGIPFGRELTLRGATERVAPILMTALTAALGLAPLAMSGSKPGYEVEYPMAVVILGGLVTSTLLNLLVLPVLYEWFGRERLQPAMADTYEVSDRDCV